MSDCKVYKHQFVEKVTVRFPAMPQIASLIWDFAEREGFLVVSRKNLEEVSATLKEGRCSKCTDKGMDYCKYATDVCGAQAVAFEV